MKILGKSHIFSGTPQSQEGPHFGYKGFQLSEMIKTSNCIRFKSPTSPAQWCLRPGRLLEWVLASLSVPVQVSLFYSPQLTGLSQLWLVWEMGWKSIVLSSSYPLDLHWGPGLGGHSKVTAPMGHIWNYFQRFSYHNLQLKLSGSKQNFFSSWLTVTPLTNPCVPGGSFVLGFFALSRALQQIASSRSHG